MIENNDIKVAKQTIDREIEALKAMEDSLDATLTEVLDILQKTKGRVIVTGMGKSGHIACKIAATMASTGTPAFFLHPGEASHGDLGMITQGDTVIAISNSGESKELCDIIFYCRRFSIPLIGITKNPDSTLAQSSDFVLHLPTNREACPIGLAPMSSTTATLVMGDVLAAALMVRRGFTEEDFKIRHPGGKLGSILRHVSDVMHTGDEMPLVSDKALMEDALLVMTSKRLGCVGILDEAGKLIGMITDGDLRRWMSPHLTAEKVVDVMTKNPRTTKESTLIAEAVNIMNNTGRGITNMFVVDENNKPVGIIHIHDCLRAGVS
ncbi:MAG: KpsF/GutQ family sugar-phosphate isomerase [Alphaproteobacteria bacterium]|nr:KpsF/GutQ family sugar-phosphate isomerase [Alphaproteobacteria bacterium]